MLSEGHEALMDRVYRRQRHLYDFTRKYYLFGRDSLIRDLALRPGERGVEIGCGTARNLIAMARRYPGVTLFGLDASSEMLKTAERAVEKAGLNGRIHLALGRAEALSPSLFGEIQPFDHAIFSYSLSMISDWKQSLGAARAALAPAGKLHVVDFGDFAGLSPPIESLLRHWLALFHVAPRTEILLALESRGAENALRGADLRTLAGRYAFIWSADGRSLADLPL
jgi:S-adenosylmethionine-diacylgycerolhomoserine-N-methlytransferase